MSQRAIFITEGVETLSGMRGVASRYLQDWVNGVSQLDPDILKEAASQGASPVGGETSPGLHGSPGERAFSGRLGAAPIGVMPGGEMPSLEGLSEPWISGSPALLYGPSAAAQEPVATIPAEALPIAETVMRSLRSRSLAYMLQGVTFHGDGVLHHKAMQGINCYISSMLAAARTYQLVELRPLVVPAVDLNQSMAFILSSYKLKHRGTGSTSLGIQVDAIKFDEALKISDVWVRRQLTLEERELLLKGGPAAHPAAVFDETAIQAPGTDEEGQDRSPEAMAAAASAAGDEGGVAEQATGDVLHQKMERYLGAWQQVWQGAPGTAAAVSTGGTEAQHPELDNILEEGFNTVDALGIHQPGSRAYQHIHGIQGARNAVNEMVACNEMQEWEYAHALSPNSNVGFAMWQAQIRPRHRRGVGNTPTRSGPLVGATDVGKSGGATVSRGVGQGKDAEGEAYAVQGLDVVLFSPNSGKLRCIYQMRSPTQREERHVLEPAPPEAAY